MNILKKMIIYSTLCYFVLVLVALEFSGLWGSLLRMDVFALILFILVFFSKNLKIRYKAVWLIFVFVLLRLLWSFFVKTEIVSDYRSYVDIANLLLKGKVENLLACQSLFHPIILALGSIIFNLGKVDYNSIVMTNISLFIISGLYIFLLAKLILKDENSAIVALYLFCAYPGLFYYSSVAGSEHTFIALLLPAIYYFYRYMDNYALKYAVISGILFSLAALTRSIGFYLFIGLGIVSIIRILNNVISLRKGAIFLIVFLGTFLVTMVPNFIIRKYEWGCVSFDANCWTMHTMLCGTNGIGTHYDASKDFLRITGNRKLIYRNEDIGKEGYISIKEWKKLAYMEIKNRIIYNYGGLFKFTRFALSTKLAILWDEGFGIFWSTLNSNIIQLSICYVILANLEYGFFILLLLAFVVGLWVMCKRSINLCVYEILFMFSVLPVAHVLVEVQGRYHIPYVIPMILVASLSISKMSLVK